MSSSPSSTAESKGRDSLLAVLLVVAITLAAVAAWMVFEGVAVWAGACALVGGAALVGAQLLASGAAAGGPEVNPRSGFAVSICARFFDAVVLGSIVWVARAGNLRTSAAALAALGGSFLAAYVGARGRALGFDVVPDGPVARGAFLALIGLGLVLASRGWLPGALLAAAVLAFAMAIAGAAGVARQARKDRAS